MLYSGKSQNILLKVRQEDRPNRNSDQVTDEQRVAVLSTERDIISMLSVSSSLRDIRTRIEALRTMCQMTIVPPRILLIAEVSLDYD